MPVLVRAAVDVPGGWVTLRFPFNRDLINKIKTIPGARWNPDETCWRMSYHGYVALQKIVGASIVWSETATPTPINRVEIPAPIASRLRPYQLEAAYRCTAHLGYLLGMEMRTGKTPSAIAAICAAMTAGEIDTAIITYPAQVADEWEKQLREWAGVQLIQPTVEIADIYDRLVKQLRDHTEGNAKAKDAAVRAQRDALKAHAGALFATKYQSTPYLFLGIHYEVLGGFGESRDVGGYEPEYILLDPLKSALDGRRWAVVADELHYAKNRKAARTDALRAIRARARYAWGLTGTPMRNRHRDMWGVFEFLHPGSMGGYWTFAKRYSGAQLGDSGHYEDKQNTNPKELKERLDAVMFRVTRREVAPWLPKSERRVIECSASGETMANYKTLERAYAHKAAAAFKGGSENFKDEAALREMILATSEAKIPTAIQRIREHAATGRKLLVFCHFQETLRKLSDEFAWAAAEEAREKAEKGVDHEFPLPAGFIVGGWESRKDRLETINDWKNYASGPAVLLANTLSSGIGIDLSDAATAMFMELEWVPADFLQAEARNQDVHKGKALEPRLYEYLICKGTIDQDMANAMFKKIHAIENVVGKDVEAGAVAKVLEESNFADSTAVGLKDQDDATVNDALGSLLARLTGEDTTDSNTKLASSVAAAFSDDDPELDEPKDLTDDDIPF